MKRPLATALLLLGLPAVALAELAVGVSIELKVAGSDLVVRARFLRRVDIEGSPFGFSVSSYRVEETLLGELRKHLDVLARDLSVEDEVVKGGEYLLFLDRHCRQFGDSPTGAAANRTPFELRDQIRARGGPPISMRLPFCWHSPS